MDFGQKVLLLRRLLKLQDIEYNTQTDLGKLLDVSRETVTAWETNRLIPKIEKLKQLQSLANQHQIDVSFAPEIKIAKHKKIKLKKRKRKKIKNATMEKRG